MWLIKRQHRYRWCIIHVISNLKNVNHISRNLLYFKVGKFSIWRRSLYEQFFKLIISLVALAECNESHGKSDSKMWRGRTFWRAIDRSHSVEYEFYLLSRSPTTHGLTDWLSDWRGVGGGRVAELAIRRRTPRRKLSITSHRLGCVVTNAVPYSASLVMCHVEKPVASDTTRYDSLRGSLRAPPQSWPPVGTVCRTRTDKTKRKELKWTPMSMEIRRKVENSLLVTVLYCCKSELEPGQINWPGTRHPTRPGSKWPGDPTRPDPYE